MEKPQSRVAVPKTSCNFVKGAAGKEMLSLAILGGEVTKIGAEVYGLLQRCHGELRRDRVDQDTRIVPKILIYSVMKREKLE